MRLNLVAFLMIAAFATGCAAKATKEDCERACANVTQVAVGEIDKQLAEKSELKDSGEAGREMAKTMAKTMLDTVESECFTECIAKADREKAECLAAAKSVEDIEACR